MARRKTWLVGYDITSPKRLGRVARLLSQQAFRVQYSLFAASWTDAAFNQNWASLAEIINPRSDDVRAWPVSDSAAILCWGMVWPSDLILGSAQNPALPRLLRPDGQAWERESDDAGFVEHNDPE